MGEALGGLAQGIGKGMLTYQDRNRTKTYQDAMTQLAQAQAAYYQGLQQPGQINTGLTQDIMTGGPQMGQIQDQLVREPDNTFDAVLRRILSSIGR